LACTKYPLAESLAEEKYHWENNMLGIKTTQLIDNEAIIPPPHAF